MRSAAAASTDARVRAKLYGDQLTSRAQANDPQWRATVATLQSLDRVHKLATTRRRLENAMFAFALVGIVCVMVESELIWSEVQLLDEVLTVSRTDGDSSASERAIAFSSGFVALKSVLSAATLALVVALVLRYRVVCQILVETKQIGARAKFFRSSSGLLAPFLVELVVCVVHVPPLVSSALTLEWQRQNNFYLDQLDVLVLLRIYLLGRLLRNLLGLSASAYYVQLIGAFHRVDVASIWFTVKFTFQKFPFQATMAALFIDWILTSAALNFLERGSNDKLTNANEAIWLTIVTMTSVGYGEIAPQTFGGKLTIVSGAIVGGTVITCLLRVMLIDALLVTPQEKIVLDVVHFHQFVRTQKDAAAFLIQQTWRWHRDRASSKDKAGGDESKHKHRVYAAAEAFRLLRFTQPSTLVASSSLSSISNNSGGSSGDAMARQMEHLHERMKTRRSPALRQLHASAQLFRNIAATSPE